MKPRIPKQILLKIRAGALQYTIAFSLLIILVLISTLLFNHIRKVELNHYEIFDSIERDVNSARLILEEKEELFTDGEKEFKLSNDFFLKDLDILIKEWGFFHTASIAGNHKNIKREKIYLFSDDIHLNQMQPSLYLSAPRKHLSVGGETYLGENTYLPANGVRKAYINGIKYQCTSLVHGVSHNALNSLPKLRDKWMNMYSYLINSISNNDSILYFQEIKSDSITNSFSNKRLVVKCQGKTTIRNKVIIGNVLLYGDDIEFKNTSSLEGCIVVAKSIILESKFKGAAQLITKNNIKVKNEAILMYPSILFCSPDTEGGICIQKKCKIQGEVISTSQKKNKELINIGKDSKITGQVYCDGTLVFHGKLAGSMYCRGFIDRTKKGVYENYLIDVSIDFERLPVEYGGIALTEQGNGKKCIQKLI